MKNSMPGKFEENRAYFVEVTPHVNYSHMADVKKSLFSFPFQDMGHDCPRNVKFTLRSDTDVMVEAQSAICMFRKVPSYLRNGKDGHLIVFFDADRDMTEEVSKATQIFVSEFSAPILDHHLCKMPYPIS